MNAGPTEAPARRYAPGGPYPHSTGRRPGGPCGVERVSVGPARSLSCGLLDGHSDEGAPLGPTAVVVPYALVSEQITKNEPRVSASLADTAIRDGLSAPVDPLRSID